MNKENVDYCLEVIDGWKTNPPSISEAQKTTRNLMGFLFPGLSSQHKNWLGGNFMATHCKVLADE